MSNYDPAQALSDKGKTLSVFIGAIRSGFESAYNTGTAEGFNPNGALSAESKDRVLAVLKAIDDSYGAVDLSVGGGVAIVGALRVSQLINEVLFTLESYANSTPEDFQRIRDELEAPSPPPVAFNSPVF